MQWGPCRVGIKGWGIQVPTDPVTPMLTTPLSVDASRNGVAVGNRSLPVCSTQTKQRYCTIRKCYIYNFCRRVRPRTKN